jgi:TatD DNase family protein
MDWQEHWRKAQSVGVNKSIIVGPSIAGNQRALKIADSNPNLYAALGIHPEEINESFDLEKSYQQLVQLSHHPRVIAIGETGLDYYYLQNLAVNDLEANKNIQKQLFIKQIVLTNQLNLPLILHVRDRNSAAYYDTLELVEKYWSFNNSLIFHCVSGPIDYIKRALTLKNSYFGFDGNITFKNGENVREIFKLVQTTDSSKILLETDCPYLAPEPFRGKVCEPYMISSIADYLENNLAANLAEIYQNSLAAFHIN